MDRTAPSQTTPLAAGQSLYFAVSAGTVLVALQGDLRVQEAPRWLGDTLVPVAQWLGEGQSHAVAQAGWVCVTSPRGARLGHTVPLGAWQRLSAWLAHRAHRQPARAVASKM